MFPTYFKLGEVVRLLETDGDFLVRETVRNEEKQIVLSVMNRSCYLFVGAYLCFDLFYSYLQWIINRLVAKYQVQFYIVKL